MKSKLFYDKIEPSCSYCRYGDYSKDKTMILCEKRGVMEPFGRCRSFVYSPLKRIPRKPQRLPAYTEDDFKL